MISLSWLKKSISATNTLWKATPTGWQYEGAINAETPTSMEPVSVYLMQLVDEGLALRTGEHFVIPWNNVYSLLRNPEHASSLPLLNLPEREDWIPRLESSGTPSDSDFTVHIVNWRKGTVAPPSAALNRIGPTLRSAGEITLMSESSWRLVQEFEEFTTVGDQVLGNERLRAVGRIVAAAKVCSADLDDYLQRTDIVAADRLGLEISRTDALGAPVLILKPTPEGAPEGWLGAFDRFDSVRERYDIPTASGGLSHVLPSAAVREALEPIKQMPGRKVASDRARMLLYNPYSVLGDRAAEAIDPDSFEKARDAAGIRFKRLQFLDSQNLTTCQVAVVDPSGQEQDLQWSLSLKEATELVHTAERSRSRYLPLFSWDGEEIELGGDTDSTLQSLQHWITGAYVAATGLRYAEVFDLSAYSDRVVGFEGKDIVVPYVARKSSGQGWLPDNIETGFIAPATESQSARRIPLTAEEVVDLAGKVEQARMRKEDNVEIPGSDVRISTVDAEQWVKSLQEHHEHAERRLREPALAKNPPPSLTRPVLQILHNIEALDYAKQSTIEPVPANADPDMPLSLHSHVHPLPHQRSGIAWLQHRLSQLPQGVRGCLLADDMGVGKTFQALCLMATFLEQQAGAHKPCLVVAPVSLLENWKTEIHKFLDSPKFGILTLYGRDLQRCRLATDKIDSDLIAAGLKKLLRADFAAHHKLVLTTYDTLRDYEFSIARVPWGIVVCDEAQKIKNPGAFVTRAAKALRAEFKIACTGTPVENSLADLWCLFDFFQPGLLGSLNDFTRSFRRTIETRAAGHEATIESLRKAIDPWVLRRMKTDVANLPPKIEPDHPDAEREHRKLPMSALQERLYSEAITQFRSALDSEDGRTTILATLSKLREICSNPAKVAFDDFETLSTQKHLEHSPKLAWLLKQLARISQRGEKVLVFTEFKDIQRLIQRAISERFHLVAAIVNGSTTVDPELDNSRQRIIDRFQEVPGFNVIILGTTAVGFGVNIQKANHVIHFTRPWNPAKEDQATDRAYRIGQTNPVYVYYPTVVGRGFETFDQRVDALLFEKRALSRDMLAVEQSITLDDFKSL